MSGSNGLHPIVNLNEKQKCPAHPSKRKYSDGAEAGRAAQRSSKSAGMRIEPYLCEACGFYHLTKSTGGDTVQLPDGKFSVGEFKALAPNHPVFSGNPEEEPPIVPGDHETRVKFARRFLQSNPEPTSEELCLALGGCTKDILRKVMRELGYRNTRGRSARWVKNVDPPVQEGTSDATESEPDTRTPLDLSYDNDEPEKPRRWHGGTDIPWREARVVENTDRIRHLALGDLIDTYAAEGLRPVLSLEDADA